MESVQKWVTREKVAIGTGGNYQNFGCYEREKQKQSKSWANWAGCEGNLPLNKAVGLETSRWCYPSLKLPVTLYLKLLCWYVVRDLLSEQQSPKTQPTDILWWSPHFHTSHCAGLGQTGNRMYMGEERHETVPSATPSKGSDQNSKVCFGSEMSRLPLSAALKSHSPDPESQAMAPGIPSWLTAQLPTSFQKNPQVKGERNSPLPRTDSITQGMWK